MRIFSATLILAAAAMLVACSSSDEQKQHVDHTATASTTTQPPTASSQLDAVHNSDAYQSAYQAHYEKAGKQITHDNASHHADEIERMLDNQDWGASQ